MLILNFYSIFHSKCSNILFLTLYKLFFIHCFIQNDNQPSTIFSHVGIIPLILKGNFGKMSQTGSRRTNIAVICFSTNIFVKFGIRWSNISDMAYKVGPKCDNWNRLISRFLATLVLVVWRSFMLGLKRQLFENEMWEWQHYANYSRCECHID